jgi:Holliday junction DNA helicase RuvA
MYRPKIRDEVSAESPTSRYPPAMIARLSGQLVSVGRQSVLLMHRESGVTYEILVPTFLLEHLSSKVDQPVYFITYHYLEGVGQGSHFVPRLIGFLTERQRDFFELFTTVGGIGNRKALRALAQEPSVIATSIASRDAKALTQLPEIGKKMAELVIAELHDKVGPFVDAGFAGIDVKGAAVAVRPATNLGPLGEDAVAAVMALGETRVDAERLVGRVLGSDRTFATVGDVLTAVLALRA